MPRPPHLIESPQNPQFKLWESLLESRGLKKQGKFLLAGLKTVPEALARWPDRFSTLLLTDPAQAEGWRVPAGLGVVQLAPALFRTLDASGTGFPLLVGTVPDTPPVDLSRPPQGLELVCALGDPSNLGALLRSAAAFGVKALVTTARHSPEATGVLAKSASGALEYVPMVTVQNLARGLNALKERGFLLVGLDSEGESDLADTPLTAPLALVLGAEGKGLRQLTRETCDRNARLDMPGAIKSLNVSNAAALALYVATTRLKG